MNPKTELLWSLRVSLKFGLFRDSHSLPSSHIHDDIHPEVVRSGCQLAQLLLQGKKADFRLLLFLLILF